MDAVIRTEELTKAFGKNRALSSLSLEVAPGEVFGYLGPNGAGKPVTEMRHSLPPRRGRSSGAARSLRHVPCAPPPTVRPTPQ